MPGKLSSVNIKATIFNNGSNFGLENYGPNTRIKLGGYEQILSNKQMMDHPNHKIFMEDFTEIWNGEHVVDYHQLVEWLSINEEPNENITHKR